MSIHFFCIWWNNILEKSRILTTWYTFKMKGDQLDMYFSIKIITKKLKQMLIPQALQFNWITFTQSHLIILTDYALNCVILLVQNQSLNFYCSPLRENNQIPQGMSPWGHAYRACRDEKGFWDSVTKETVKHRKRSRMDGYLGNGSGRVLNFENKILKIWLFGHSFILSNNSFIRIRFFTYSLICLFKST